MKKSVLSILALLSCVFAFGQKADLRIASRMGANEKGFEISHLFIEAAGDISDKFSFGFLQHLNKAVETNPLLSAADYAFIKYSPDDHWSFRAGKIFICFGSWEYDDNSIDIYNYNRYLWNYTCFQPGFDVTYSPNQGKDRFMIQMTRSALSDPGQYDLFEYGAMWLGTHDWIRTQYSVNFELGNEGRHRYAVAFGNRCDFGRLHLDVDLATWFYSYRQLMPFQRSALTCVLRYDILNNWQVYAKGCLDHDKDVSTWRGYSAGTEFYPVKDRKSVILFANFHHSIAENISTNNFSIGVTYKFDWPHRSK